MVSPFGATEVTVGLDRILGTSTLNFQASFSSSAGTLSALDPGETYTSMGSAGSVQGTAKITGGTGAFAGASGSLTYSFMGDGSAVYNQIGTLSGSGTIQLQSITTSLPDAMVGVPYSINVGQGLSQLPAGAQFGVAEASNLPPGLTLSASGSLSGTPTQAGNYMFSLTFQGAALSGTLQATLNVTGNAGPAVTVSPGALSFGLTQGSTAAVTRSVVIANSGGATESFTVSATPSSGGNWLSVSPGAGTVAPYSSTSISVAVDPSRLNVGTYLGTVSIVVIPEQPDIRCRGAGYRQQRTSAVAASANRISFPDHR